MGIIKPDVVTIGTDIIGNSYKGYSNGACTIRSGTSVTAPIVAASIALVINEDYVT